MPFEIQKFKANDAIETSIMELFDGVLDPLGVDIDSFYEDGYESWALGQVLKDTASDPLSRMVTVTAFIRSFNAIHNSYQRPGIYSFYISIFRKIWGDSIDIEFLNPNPGHLIINLDATDLQEEILIARDIVDDQYVFNELVTTDSGENIIVRTTLTPWTQYEVLKLMRAIAPAWVHIEVNLEES